MRHTCLVIIGTLALPFLHWGCIAETLEEGPAQCVDGQRVACSCIGGDSGWQTCGVDGTFDACSCMSGNEPHHDSEDPVFTMISVGNAHTCGITESGSLRCWGVGEDGQADVPDEASGEQFSAVAAGTSHTCAVNADQSILCWGRNSDGQLGVESAGDAAIVSWKDDSPLQLVSIQSGENHNVGITDQGKTVAWGNNVLRQSRPGFDNLDEPSHEAAVLGLLQGTFEEASAGANHSCALRTDGAVRCWGSNRHAQLGFAACEPDASPCSDEKKTVELSGAFVDVVAGGRHTCVLDTTSRIQCWGAGDQGQLGDSLDGESSAGAVELDMPATPSRLGESLAATQCLITDANRVVCWGDNRYGQADPSSSAQSVSPTVLDLPNTALRVHSGARHTCALLSSGQVSCWGAEDRADPSTVE